MALYALQLPTGVFVEAYAAPGEEYDFYTLSAVDDSSVPYLVDEPSSLRHWVKDAADKSRKDPGSYNAYYEPAFRSLLARAQIVEVQVSVVGEVR